MTDKAEPDDTEKSNPFILPGLPAHTAAAGRKLVADSKRQRRRPHSGDQYDHWDDKPTEVLSPTGSLAESLAAHHDTSEPEGDWSAWLDPTPHRAPLSPEDDEYPGDDSDDWNDDWDGEGPRHPRRRPAAAVLAWWRAREILSRAWPTLTAAAVTVGIVATVTTVVMLNVQEATDTVDTAAPPLSDDARAIGAEPPEEQTNSPAREHAIEGCRRTRTDSITIGAGPGDKATPQGVILQLEWAYYVTRSAALIRELTTPDAAVYPEHVMQAGIDSQPRGARYCVYITAADESDTAWDVQIHEQWPGEPQPSRYAQTITTTVIDGEARITGIRAAG